MPTELIRPNSDIAFTWFSGGAVSPYYDNINDAVTQPTSPSNIARADAGGGYGVTHNKNDDSEVAQFGFTAPATAGTMTGVDLWIFGEATRVYPSDSPKVWKFRVRLNGTWSSYQDYSGNNTPLDGSSENPSWTSYHWSMSGAAIGSAPAFGCLVPSVDNGEQIYIYCAYLVITTSGTDILNRKRRGILLRFLE